MSNAAASTFIYVTYIRTTPEKLWAALTNPKTIKQYWFGCTCESDFKKGSPWKLIMEDGRLADSGEIIDVEPGKRLVIKKVLSNLKSLLETGEIAMVQPYKASSAA
jgi:uncharacterized protein YndB with AHSA1/START domain